MYGEFFDDNFNFRSWPEVLPVSQEHYKCVHLTCFLTNSCMANLKVMFSTSGHHRKYFRFPKNITNVTSNNICLLVSYNCQPRCFSYQFTYGEFFGHMFNFRSWPEVLPVFLRTLKLVTSTCFPSNPSTLNSMKIFSTSGYGFRSLLVCRKHYENVTSTLFLNKKRVRWIRWRYFQRSVMTGSTSGFSKTFKNFTLYVW